MAPDKKSRRYYYDLMLKEIATIEKYLDNPAGTHYQLFGTVSMEDLEYLRDFPKMLFVCGDFGAGKTTLIRLLERSKRYRLIPKESTRTPRAKERSGEVPFKGIGWREAYNIGMDEPIFCCFNCDILNVTSFEDTMQDLLDDPVALGDFLAQFISIYFIRDLVRLCKEALKDNVTTILEITPEQIGDWAYFFFNAKAVNLKCHEHVRKKRLYRRRKDDPEIDPTGKVTKMKLESSTSVAKKRMPHFYQLATITLSNNNLVELVKAYLATRWLCEKTGFIWSFLRLNTQRATQTS